MALTRAGAKSLDSSNGTGSNARVSAEDNKSVAFKSANRCTRASAGREPALGRYDREDDSRL